MKNSESVDRSTYSLYDQYVEISKDTLPTSKDPRGSEVMQWADVSFTSEPTGNFQGVPKKSTNNFLNKLKLTFNGT